MCENISNLPPNTCTHLMSSLDVLGYGYILFDDHHKAIHTSALATQYIERIGGDVPGTYQDVMALFSEYAVFDNTMINMASRFLARGENANVFAEMLVSQDLNDHIWAQVLSFGENGVLLLLSDANAIIQYVRHKQELDWQYEILLQAVEGANSGVIVFDPAGPDQVVHFVNQACCDLVWRNRSDVLGRSWKELFPGFDPRVSDRYHMVDAEGNEHVVAIHISMQDKLGLIFIADVSEINEKEAQLHHIQKLDQLGQLAGGIAHDFNNILGVIKGYGHLLEKWVHNDNRSAPAVSNILNACARGTALSGKLLAFSRPSPERLNACNLQTFVKGFQEMIVPLLPPKITLECILPNEKIGVGCSEDHLMQILMNLVINARDAMASHGQEGTIILRARADDKRVIFDVEDTGGGIPPDIRSRIFEPFFTTKEVGKGTGLGLSVVYGLVKQHQGEISIMSEPGHGTIFTIILPRTEPQEERIKKDGGQSFDGLTVMLVDDEETVRAPLKLFLEEQGMIVTEAESGDEALMLQDDIMDPIDILISDVRMPGLYGDELAKLWRDIRPDSAIILVSGYTEGRDMQGSVCDAFLSKPIDYTRILIVLEEALSHNEPDRRKEMVS